MKSCTPRNSPRWRKPKSSNQPSGIASSPPRTARSNSGSITCAPTPARVSPKRSRPSATIWRCTDATASLAPCAAKRSCASAMPITKRTTAPAARPGEKFSPIAACRGCSDRIGRAHWRNWKRCIGSDRDTTCYAVQQMASELRIRVNERSWKVAAAPDTPLLYVLANELQLQGPRFGCGLAQCGSCSVLVNGVETRSCVTPVSAVQGKSVTTLEGLPALYAAQKRLSKAPELHPVQQAMIDEQAVQCGYCFNGMIIKASELLSKVPQPDEAQIRAAMNGHLCRCGTYPRVIKAIQRASRTMMAEAAK